MSKNVPLKSHCNNCDKEFSYKPSQSGGIYCSVKCQWQYQVREAVESGSYTKATAKTYFKHNTEYKCSCCGINEWNDKPIILQIDHIDGNTSNNLVENLRYLCPNCHSQTDTWSSKNMSAEGLARVKLAGKLGNDIRNGKLPKGTKLEDVLVP